MIAIIIYLVSFKNEPGLWILTFLCPSLSFFSGCVTFLNSLDLVGATGDIQSLSAFGDDIKPYIFIIILFL